MDDIITINDYYSITKEKQLYTIEFKYPAYEIINSLIKTRIIRDGITDDSHTIIKFKATSVKTLEQHQANHKNKYGKSNFRANELAHVIQSLTIQLDYILTYENSTILGYNPKDIIVIDNEKFACIGSELVAKIDFVRNEMAMISSPYSSSDFFFSPEMLIIKELPSYIHFKTTYFSLGCLLIYTLEGNDEFYKNYLNDTTQWLEKLLEPLTNHSIKNTKLYWIILRCLKEEPTERSLIYI